MSPGSAAPGHEASLLTIAAIAAALLLAWSGILDGVSAEYIDKALLGSGAIYATARGINALVSVLQGTEIDAFILTLTVGELLDPLNDLIERFSGLMMLALGSLALQKILLEVVSDVSFNVLLTILGLSVVVSGYLLPQRICQLIKRFFVITAFIRFSFAAVILANSWADAIFLNDNVDRQHSAIDGFYKQLGAVAATVGIETDLAADVREIEVAIAGNEAERVNQQRQRYRLGNELDEAMAKLEVEKSKIAWWRGTTVDIEGLKAQIRTLESSIDDIDNRLANLAETRQILEDKLSCIKARDGCSWGDKASRVKEALNIKEKINKLLAEVDAFASSLISLLMSLILKSVLLPILFLYVLLRASKYLFERA